MAGRSEIVRESVQNRECPACGALPGEPCRDNHGRDIIHGERLNGDAPKKERAHATRTPYASSYVR